MKEIINNFLICHAFENSFDIIERERERERERESSADVLQ
jgi:hypothetical protein